MSRHRRGAVKTGQVSLEGLSYKELEAMAKARGIAGNQSTEALIKASKLEGVISHGIRR